MKGTVTNSMLFAPVPFSASTNVTLHTKTRLNDRGNLGETGFQTGFQRVLNSQNRVTKGFPKGFQRVSKGFQMTETGFLKGFQNPETRFLKHFKRVSNEFPNRFQTV